MALFIRLSVGLLVGHEINTAILLKNITLKLIEYNANTNYKYIACVEMKTCTCHLIEQIKRRIIPSCMSIGGQLLIGLLE